MLKKLILILLASSLTTTVLAASKSAAAESAARARAAVLTLVPGVQIDQIKPAPIPGFYQVIVSGQLVYVSANGKYMFNGSLFDLNAKKDLSNAAWGAFRKSELAKVPLSQRIIFAPAHPVHTITVFTDVTCGFCRQLHRHIAEFNKEGIAVDYLAWPREGIVDSAGDDTKTYTEMVSVWCAANRNKALTAAMDGDMPKVVSCTNPVKQEYKLGIKLGVSGTPAVIAEDGSLIGGYLAPEQMRAKLDELAAQKS